MNTQSDVQEQVRATVREGYGAIAQTGTASCGTGGGSCCGSSSAAGNAEELAKNLGYDPKDLDALPQGANLGLSCGNPNALAALKEGETVLDLGSGGGFDVFVAGRKVGATGRVIGVDMTAEMLSLARRNATQYRELSGLDNVEFRLGEIEHLPVADSSIDVVISNCVINLSPDKAQVWREISRVLKPGGRVAVSDIALLHPLPDWVMRKVEALIGCIAGAVLLEDTLAMVASAGLEAGEISQKPQAIDAMLDINDPIYRDIVKSIPPGSKASDYVTSVNISATKASQQCCGSSTMGKCA